jgi:hypothetical protein
MQPNDFGQVIWHLYVLGGAVSLDFLRFRQEQGWCRVYAPNADSNLYDHFLPTVFLACARGHVLHRSGDAWIKWRIDCEDEKD